MVAVVGGGSTSTTNAALVSAWREEGIDAVWLDALDALAFTRPGDVVVGRIDVRASLDGIEPGLLELLRLAARGVRLVNRPRALLTTHDKLATARRLAARGVAHPATVLVRDDFLEPPLEPPVVVKPRFGSWGADVRCCDTRASVRDTLRELSARPWFRRQGALVQRLVPPRGFDLRVLVAAGRVVGAIRRRAAAGEWRTNYSLGGTLESVLPPRDACALAVTAAAAVDADFVGVDLLPTERGWVVLELNGAVDFEPAYARAGSGSVYAAVADALALPRQRGGRLAAAAGRGELEVTRSPARAP